MLVVVGVDVGVHPLFELHLVTAAQRGYSFALLEVYGAKFTEAMKTFAEYYAYLASSACARRRCG